MEQRPLRLGDLVDDYCPRERRITNHAIVAIVGDSIRQTRCTTCEAEHVYKGGKVPPRRSRHGTAEGDTAVDNTGGQLVAPSNGTGSAQPEGPITESLPDEIVELIAEPAASADDAKADGAEEQPSDESVWPANRTLIRATLPRTEGELPPPRPIPEFTMHRYNPRGAGPFRQGRGGWPDRSAGHGGNGARGDRRQGPGDGFGGGQGHGRRRHGKKRPR